MLAQALNMQAYNSALCSLSLSWDVGDIMCIACSVQTWSNVKCACVCKMHIDEHLAGLVLHTKFRNHSWVHADPCCFACQSHEASKNSIKLHPEGTPCKVSEASYRAILPPTFPVQRNASLPIWRETTSLNPNRVWFCGAFTEVGCLVAHP